MTSTLKKAVILLLAAVLACSFGLLTACGSSNSNSNNTNNTSTDNSNKNSNSNSNKNSNENKNSNKNSNSGKNASGQEYIKSVADDDPYGKGIHHAEVTVEGYEPFIIELDADNAPISVSNFCDLANKQFYDGLTFYRFQDGFCMQGGSSNNGTAIVDDGLKAIKGEFSSNNVKNKLADDFKKGTVAMARSGDPNSATSTFFVTLDSSDMVSASLDGEYAAFGTIDEAGMEIVDKIVADYIAAAKGNMGVINDVDKQAKITSIKVID